MAVGNYRILKKIYSDWQKFHDCIDEGKGYTPIDIEIRLNWKCNARCVMCGLNEYISNSVSYKRREMKYHEITHLLDQLKEKGCCNVTFSGGEPTLRDDLTEIVAYASKKCNMFVSLNTNGYLLDEARIKELIDAGVEIFTFSVDSPVEEIHDSIRGLKGSLNNIKRAIDYINDYCKDQQRNILIFINCVILKNNIKSLGSFKDFYMKHKFHHLNFSPASIGTPWDEWTTDKDYLRPSKEDILYLKNEVLTKLQGDNWELAVDDPFGDNEEEIEKNLHVIFFNRPSRCFVPMVHTVVQCNGDVIPCCYAPDEFIMGNMLERPFEEIWNGEKYVHFRHQCTEAKFRMCVSCRQYELLNNKIIEKLNKTEVLNNG